MSEPTFPAVNIKLGLPLKFAGKPSKLSGWLFNMEQYYNIMGIVKPVDRVRLAVSQLECDAFTWWRQLTICGDEYKLEKLVWSDFEAEVVSAFSDIDYELRLHHQLGSLR